MFRFFAVVISCLLCAQGFASPTVLEPRSKSKSKSKSWEKFKKSFGKEKVKLKFPTPPEMTTQGGTIIYSAEDPLGVKYTLVALPVPEHHEFRDDVSGFFLSFLSQFSTTPFEVKHFDLYRKDSMGLVDALVYWPDTDEMLRGRVIATKYNLYLLGTSHSPHIEESHDYFIESFEVEK